MQRKRDEAGAEPSAAMLSDEDNCIKLKSDHLPSVQWYKLVTHEDEKTKLFFKRRVMLFAVVVCFLYILKLSFGPEECDMKKMHYVDPEHVKRAQKYAKLIQQGECRPSFVKKEMNRLFAEKYRANIFPFVREDIYGHEDVFKYKPPFGFHKNSRKLQNLLKLLPEHDLPENLKSKHCKRCVVVGSGGILHGLELGHVLNEFDIVIRCIFLFCLTLQSNLTFVFFANSLSFWEGKVKSQTPFITYQHNLKVMFNIQSIPAFILQLSRGRESSFAQQCCTERQIQIIQVIEYIYHICSTNKPFVVTEVLYQCRVMVYVTSRGPFHPYISMTVKTDKGEGCCMVNVYFSFQNVPTIGVTAVVLATHLCDEVSLAGFGYDLRQPNTPLHYYDNLCMAAMEGQTMHNVTTETKFLQKLIKEGIVKDLSGGIQCEFCKKPS
ncbi:lactosylceramide alpha-2,3-sialyltransferase [Chelonoidis abingdonii]|uniref:lactosylceramide alpha-2,3-sialyltransferase n=1 Tax=Chelonoidis abingdonii TaxID=106734 RepID=UPI003F499FCB